MWQQWRRHSRTGHHQDRPLFPGQTHARLQKAVKCSWFSESFCHPVNYTIAFLEDSSHVLSCIFSPWESTPLIDHILSCFSCRQEFHSIGKLVHEDLTEFRILFAQIYYFLEMEEEILSRIYFCGCQGNHRGF